MTITQNFGIWEKTGETWGNLELLQTQNYCISFFSTNRKSSPFADNAEPVNPPQSIYRICNLCSDFSKKCGGFSNSNSANTLISRRKKAPQKSSVKTETFVCGKLKTFNSYLRSRKTFQLVRFCGAERHSN